MKILVSLMTIFCLMSTAGYAQTGGCAPRKETPVINIHYVDRGVVYNSNLTGPQIQAVMSHSDVVTADMMQTALNGLTVSHLSMTANSNLIFTTTANKICVYPYDINIEVGYNEPQIVYIKNKYPDGTCQKDAILQHENGHVTINQNVAQSLAFALKSDLENLVNDPGYPFPVPTKEYGSQVINALIQQHIDADFAQAKSQNRSLNGQLDTPENYRATTRLCSNW